MGRRITTIVAVCVLAAGLLPGAGFAAQDTVGDDLATVRERLAGAEEELSGLEAAVRRINDEVAALDLQLTAATTTRAAVSEELQAAQAAATVAVGAERAAAASLAAADEQLTGTLDAWQHSRDRLADRAVHAYKYGSTTAQDVFVRGVAGADDFHDVAVTLETVGRMSAKDRDLADEQATTTRDTATVHAEVAALRAEAVATARTATAEADRVATLAEQHRQIVSVVATTHEQRSDVLRGLEQDTAARAVLVQQLEGQVASLELAASRVLIPVVVDLDPYGPAPAWAAGLPAAGPTWAAAIEATGARHGIDGRLLAALIWTESNFRADAVSHAGALGLAQLMPETARGLGVDPRDPLANLDGGARFLRSQLDRFGRVDLALAAYNAGPGRVARDGAVPDIVETQLYVVRVLDRYAQLGG